MIQGFFRLSIWFYSCIVVERKLSMTWRWRRKWWIRVKTGDCGMWISEHFSLRWPEKGGYRHCGVNPTENKVHGFLRRITCQAERRLSFVRQMAADTKLKTFSGKPSAYKMDDRKLLPKIKDAKIVSLAHVPEVVLELKRKVDGLVVEGIVGGQSPCIQWWSYVLGGNSRMQVKDTAAAVQRKGNEMWWLSSIKVFKIQTMAILKEMDRWIRRSSWKMLISDREFSYISMKNSPYSQGGF